MKKSNTDRMTRSKITSFPVRKLVEIALQHITAFLSSFFSQISHFINSSVILSQTKVPVCINQIGQYRKIYGKNVIVHSGRFFTINNNITNK
jgi:hypothetical protein